jgi:Pyruvate/2-oxoacid:ferredoxin oxidoreductase delta subunit
MDSDVYRRLGERLNQNMVRYPLIEEVLRFLKRIFSEEEAALGAEFPLGAHTARDLAITLGREENELADFLERMADQGLIFVSKNDEGESKYSLVPFVPGLVEFQSMRGTETEEDIETAKILRAMNEAMEALQSEQLKNPEVANKLPAGLRTITVEEELPDSTSIRSYEQVSAIIDREKSFAVGYCHCRHTNKLTGSPCEIEDAPARSCFYFGKVADFMVERDFAKRVTRDECMQILKQCEEAGLVHNVSDIVGSNLVLCNCCGCCCGFLVKTRKYRGLRNVSPSNFKMTVDADSCTGCEECVSRCAVEAISMRDDCAHIDPECCLGCGNCASSCPAESLIMVRESDAEPARIPIELVGLGR